MEPLLGGEPLSTADGERWAAAATSVLDTVTDRGGDMTRAASVERAEALLCELRAEEFAHLSEVLRSGLEQRLACYAAGLGEYVKDPNDAAFERLKSSAAAVLQHSEARRQPERAGALAMSLRLARWLARDAAEPASFPDAALRYANDTGWVDRARAAIDDGDSLPAAADAYRALAERVTQRRERENRRFGELLARWIAVGSTGDQRLVSVEHVLAEVVAPLARAVRVLLVVMDGLSFAVFHELMSDVASLGWVELANGNPPQRRVAVAALPSVTEASRTSLLCGALKTGDADVERQGFASCAELVSISRSAYPPVLFHKADLRGEGNGGLAPEVVTAIARTTRQVVGVVVNTVDDHLAKGDQLRVPWTVASIRPLRSLLDAAREAGRVVVLTSDHGHVSERNLTHRAHETGGFRYREDDGAPADDEVALRGARVLHAGSRIIAPWSERVRYGVRQNGYHGGATPQEIVVPLVVLAADRQVPQDWTEIAAAPPAWWETALAPAEAPATRAMPRLTEQATVGAPAAQADLFTPGEPPAAVPWIDRLLASPVFAAQKALAGRAVLPDARVRACLLALEERGGKLTRPALAHALGVPPIRIGGFIAALRRLLNVDGYPVLTFDEASETIEINVGLLTVQFEL
jgi:hypothetical protein